MTQIDNIKIKIIEQADFMAKEIVKGKHIEIHRGNGRITIYSVDKKKVG